MDEQIKLCQHKLQTQFENLTALTQLLDDELNSLVSRRGENLKELAKNKINLLNAIQKSAVLEYSSEVLVGFDNEFEN